MTDTVLIVGAGPTGLIMACELISMGVPCRLIDRLEKPVETSRSFTIHARTLELLDKLGLAEEFQEKGHESYAMDYYFAGKDKPAGVNFRELDSLYKFVLIINQQDTEAILRNHLERLGGKIEWMTQLDSVEQVDENTVNVQLTNLETDETENLKVDWLIGCDGIGSVVRKNLNLPFDGHEYAGEMKMMDVAVDGFPHSDDAIYYFVNRDHMLLVTKLPGDNYRVLISDTGQGATTETARDDFQRVVDMHFNGAVTLSEPEWTTIFRISRRKTDNFRVNNIFLAGDSAHVNSPAGGQGMNVSMQDAFNLAWKLALVVKRQANPSILDSYGLERLPVAKQMHEGTQYLHDIIMAHGRGMEERLQLMQAPDWNYRAANQIAGISYTYRNPEGNSPLVDGDRAPNVQLDGDETLYQYIDKTGFTLLVVLPEELDDATVETAEETVANLSLAYPLTACLVASQGFESELSVIVDSDARVRESYAAPDSTGYYLLRPDRHIALITDSADAIAEHLNTFMISQ